MLEQILAVTLLNLRAIPSRWGASLVIVVGIAGVVGVLISVLAMAQGFLDTMHQTGQRDRAIVLRGNSQSELASTLSRSETLTITDAPGIRKDPDGQALASADVVAIIELPLKSGGTSANVTLRGVGPQAFALRPEIHVSQGRRFQPGLREVIVGRSVVQQFSGADLGSHIAFRDSDWVVVGIFDSGDSHDSEVWADSASVLAAYRRNLFQSVTVRLESEASFDALQDYLTHYPQLSVEVKRETDYYARIAQQLGLILTFVAYGVGSIMAVGALFGALNTMYSAVSARTVEIATLRAIGFGATPILISVFVEALALALVGAVIGASLAWVFFNGNAVNSLSGNFTQVVFHLSITPALAVLGIGWAALIGLLGGLFPALRAVRRPVVEALRGG